MKKTTILSAQEIREGFPTLLWGSAVAATLVIILTIVAFYFIEVQHEAEKTQAKTSRVLDIADSLAEAFELKYYTPGSTDGYGGDTRSLVNRLRGLVPVDDERWSIIERLEQWTEADSVVGKYSQQIGSNLNSLKRKTLELSSFQRTKTEATRQRLQAILIMLTCLILVVIAFSTGAILGELKHRYKAYRREKELNRLKSHFISIASHEFRTPLSSIKLSVSLVEKYAEMGDPGNILKQTKKIHYTISNLAAILEDFLSIEKLENGKLVSVPQRFDLAQLCHEVIEEIQVMLQPKQHLHYLQQGTRTEVWMDKNLLRNSIINLLSNSAKYAGEQATITLETLITENRIVVKVADDGVGVPDVHQKNLFTPFYRVNPNTSIPGTGLGLTIVKKYAELMSGVITFSSIPNHETSFELSFPVFRSPHV